MTLLTMSTMDRYIGRTVLSTILVVLVCFVTLTTLFSLVEELREEEVAYGVREAFLYVLHTSPRRIYELVPYVVFLGALIGLGDLSNNSEMTVFRSAGVSLNRIFGALAVPIVGVSLVAFGLGEYLAPRLDAQGEALRSHALQDSETIDLGGYWYREGGLYTHVEGLGAAGNLVGVSQFEIDEAKHLVYSRHAESATYDAAGGFWRLRNVSSTLFEDERTVLKRFDELPWRSHADPRLLSAQALVDPHKLSIANLDFQIRYMDREGLQAGRYRLALWGKIFQPLGILGLVLIAVGFVVGPLREVGMGTRLTVGVVVGLLFKYMQDLFAPASLVFEIPAWLAVIVPIAACWAAGWLLVRRAA